AGLLRLGHHVLRRADPGLEVLGLVGSHLRERVLGVRVAGLAGGLGPVKHRLARGGVRCVSRSGDEDGQARYNNHQETAHLNLLKRGQGRFSPFFPSTPDPDALLFGAIVPFQRGGSKNPVGGVKTEDATASRTGDKTFLTRSEVSKLLGVSP